MEREANYVAVGAFVLLLAVMGVLFVYWYSDSREQHTYNKYEVYFDGSVSGLSVGGPVRYLGVDIGRVARIRLDPISAAAFDELVMYLHGELKLTIVMITHDLDTIYRTCTRVGVLVNRHMVSDTLAGIVSHPEPWIHAYFMGERARERSVRHGT